jgi:hypothetical protein
MGITPAAEGQRRPAEMTFKRIKTITTHAGYGRFLGECDDLGLYLARVQREEIPSPYVYSPATPLYLWNGKRVLVSEVSHRRYQVFEVSPYLLTFTSEEAATEWHVRRARREG